MDGWRPRRRIELQRVLGDDMSAYTSDNVWKHTDVVVRSVQPQIDNKCPNCEDIISRVFEPIEIYKVSNLLSHKLRSEVKSDVAFITISIGGVLQVSCPGDSVPPLPTPPTSFVDIYLQSYIQSDDS